MQSLSPVRCLLPAHAARFLAGRLRSIPAAGLWGSMLTTLANRPCPSHWRRPVQSPSPVNCLLPAHAARFLAGRFLSTPAAGLLGCILTTLANRTCQSHWKGPVQSPSPVRCLLPAHAARFLAGRFLSIPAVDTCIFEPQGVPTVVAKVWLSCGPGGTFSDNFVGGTLPARGCCCSSTSIVSTAFQCGAETVGCRLLCRQSLPDLQTVALRRRHTSFCSSRAMIAQAPPLKCATERQSKPPPLLWSSTIWQWCQEQLEILGRSLLLLYLFAVARVVLYATPLTKGEQGGNAHIRGCRTAFKGAPLMLALFWPFPLCQAMDLDSGNAHLLAGDSGSVDRGFQAFTPMQNPHAASSSSDAFPAPRIPRPPAEGGPSIMQHLMTAGSDVEPASVRAVAIAYRFQQSPCYTAEWIDPGDPVSLVVQGFCEEFLGDADDAVLVPVVPQPLNKMVTFLISPPWAVEMLLTPVLISVTQSEACFRFVEMMPGRITTDDIRDAVGEAWPPDACVFIEDALRPMEDEEIAHLRPALSFL